MADLAIYGAVSGGYSNPKLGVLQGEPDVNGKIPANAISVKFNGVTVGADPGDESGDVTTDPKVYSYPGSGKANIIFERYHYNREVPPVGTFRSVISVFDSDFSEANMTTAVAAAGNVTSWGGSTADISPNYVVNARSFVQIGDYLLAISFDQPKISKIKVSDKSLMGSAELSNPAGKITAGQALAVVDGRAYALFIRATAFWGDSAAYDDSIVVEIDPNGASNNPIITSNQTTVGKNAVKLVPC